MRKFFDAILFFFTILAGLALLVSYLSVYVNPTVYWFFGLTGLAYPFLLLANVASLIYWIVRWKWTFLYPLVFVLLGFTHLSSFFQFPSHKQRSPSSDNLKVISYNVNLFHLYSWSKTGPTYKQVFEFLKNEKPNIVCLQEFYVENSKFSESQAKEKTNLNHHFGYVVKKSKSSYGLATFTTFPIVGKGEVKFESTANACIYTNIKMGNDTVRVYNIHLQSLKLKERNMNFILDQNYRKDAQAMDEIKDISLKYRDALKKRAKQVEIVTKHIFSCPYPVIVCGDFNDSPISYIYWKIQRNLNDAFVEAGSGVGHTYKGFFPSFRIDYILYSPIFSATSYNSPGVSYSDHYPVVTTLRKE